MTDSPMTGLDRKPVATTVIAFCGGCGTPWVPKSVLCAACGFRPENGNVREAAESAGRPEFAGSSNTTAKNPVLFLNVATLITVVVTAALVLLSLGGLDRRLSAVEDAAAAIDTSSLQADLGRIESQVSDLSRTITNPSTPLVPDYSGDLRSISSDVSTVSDMVFEVDSTVRSINDKADIICSALPGC